MRVVLYDNDSFEPITIIEMYDWRQLSLRRGDPIRVPVPRPVRLSSSAPDITPEEATIKTVTVRFEAYHRSNGVHGWMAFTDDAESALLLRAAFLPGQQWLVQEIGKQEFAKGFLAGLRVALG